MLLNSLLKFVTDMPKVKQIVESTIVDGVELIAGRKMNFKEVDDSSELPTEAHLSYCASLGKLHATQGKEPLLEYNWTSEQQGTYLEFYNNESEKRLKYGK